MKLIFAALLLMFATAGGLAQTSSTTYADKEYPFTIAYPNSWRAVANKTEGTRLEASRGRGNALEFFSVSAKFVPGNEKLSSAAAVKFFLETQPELIQTLADNYYPSAKLIAKGRTTFGGHEAFFLIAEGQLAGVDDPYTERVYMVQTLVDGNLYSISFSAAVDVFESSLPQYKSIAATARITAKTARSGSR